jgi:ribonuclease HI
MKVRIFTDGACSKNGQTGAIASWACWFPDNTTYSRSGRVPDSDIQTNQRAELMAIFKAVEIAKESFNSGETDIQIYTDSMYSKNCLTTWLPSWIRKDWKNTQGAAVAHRDLIETTATTLSKFKTYTIVHVLAHTNKDDELSRNNAIVDRMATEVIHPNTEIKIVSNQSEAIPGIPISLMGPPISRQILVDWCRANIDKLDADTVDSALITALTKTIKTKGFELTKQRLHRTEMFRLVSSSHLIRNSTVIVKEE